MAMARPKENYRQPMNNRLPSLARLRAFEAAARLGSFAAAAAELQVTAAAVSQKVRALETSLGFALFTRRANALELTDQGRAYQPGLQHAFDAIARLTAEVRAMRLGPVLTVGVAPALAMHWLIPRLATFNRDHPQIEVCIATGGLMNPLRDDWTCTIRRGNGDWPGYNAEELFPSTLVAACTPALAAQLHRPADLRRVPAIVVAHLRGQRDWWFSATGNKPVKPQREVSFGSSAMAVQAALDGVGVLVAQLPYVSDALASGRLIAPFGIPRVRYESWYLAYRPMRGADTALVAFGAWLRDEAARERLRHPVAGTPPAVG